MLLWLYISPCMLKVIHLLSQFKRRDRGVARVLKYVVHEKIHFRLRNIIHSIIVVIYGNLKETIPSLNFLIWKIYFKRQMTWRWCPTIFLAWNWTFFKLLAIILWLYICPCMLKVTHYRNTTESVKCVRS